MNTLSLKAYINLHEGTKRLVSDEQICERLRESCMRSAGTCLLRQCDVTVTEPEVFPGNSMVQKACEHENCGLLSDRMNGGLRDMVEVAKIVKTDYGTPKA